MDRVAGMPRVVGIRRERPLVKVRLKALQHEVSALRKQVEAAVSAELKGRYPNADADKMVGWYSRELRKRV